jgi:hypothetical protein
LEKKELMCFSEKKADIVSNIELIEVLQKKKEKKKLKNYKPNTLKYQTVILSW